MLTHILVHVEAHIQIFALIISRYSILCLFLITPQISTTCTIESKHVYISAIFFVLVFASDMFIITRTTLLIIDLKCVKYYRFKRLKLVYIKIIGLSIYRLHSNN